MCAGFGKERPGAFQGGSDHKGFHDIDLYYVNLF